jgi:diguanylate cyclase (GGDEF)-like protein
MNNASQGGGSISKTLIAISGVVLVAVAGMLDSMAGGRASLTLLYVVPVVLVGWAGSRWGSLLVALLGATAVFLVQQWGSRSLCTDIPVVWAQALNVFGVLMLFALMTSALRELRLRTLAGLDRLTGVLSADSFFRGANRELSRAKRFKRPCTLVYFDIDNFKEINDKAGYEEADMVMKATVEQIKRSIRTVDIMGRLGGDEFAILFPETGPEQAHTAVSKLEKGFSSLIRNRQWTVTLSIGAVTYFTVPEKADEMVRRASDLVAEAKREGRNKAKFEVMS